MVEMNPGRILHLLAAWLAPVNMLVSARAPRGNSGLTSADSGFRLNRLVCPGTGESLFNCFSNPNHETL
jgi:hypothetical protein